MKIYYLFAAAALFAVTAYLIGGINGALIMSRLVYRQDIRTLGSGNPGFTNFKRVYGLNAATFTVLFIDIAKTAVPVLLSALFFEKAAGLWQEGAAFAGLFCMIGHCWPIWYGFKGGKAFIAGFAVTWFVDWRMALIAMAVFALFLFTVKIMSLSSCIAALTCPIVLGLLGPASLWAWCLCAASALLVILRHKSNFVRLVHGEEPKFSFKSSN